MRQPKKIICLAVDDEPLALSVLEQYIDRVPQLQLAAACNTAVEALSALQHHAIDLLFLDIQMPQWLGADFIKTLTDPPKIIFTTAVHKFVVEGFEENAMDYLLKPISFDRFIKTVNKVMETDLSTTPTQNLFTEKETTDPHLYFRADRKMIKVSLADILYIESLKDYIRVVTQTKNIITRKSISSLEETLPPQAFIRIHRSFIIALNKIESYNSEMVEVAKKKLPISRMYKHEVGRVLKLEA
ncbi:LytR/AlgR family response regulator transcription factor [Chryseolinea soli]|uniref:DNA-binding response regulator n=1 Tax=Chryseolinea soli TaxID=2321403 RepID=A0A385SV18_9BACT|nr:LytTR family DNA-binding domain-containing protein [Chryseolinea soli]AYB34151.1 DNA-binding response regulator [Chryseolinea soli]